MRFVSIIVTSVLLAVPLAGGAQAAAAFGHMVSGLDVVRRIYEQGPLQTARHDDLVTPVAITTARRR